MNSAALQVKREQLAASIPTCATDKECEMKWSAARQWVLANSGFKIQLLTNDFLETYNPPRGATQIAVRVAKEPMADGGYRFVVTTWCGNIFGCVPDQWAAAQAFNDHLNAVRVAAGAAR